MIVFFGRLDDPPFALAVETAAGLGADYLLLDQAGLHRADLVVEVGPPGAGGWLRSAGREVRLQDVTGVYARPLELPATWPDSLGRHRAEALSAAFVDWLDVAGCMVVNRPAAMDSGTSKPYQAQRIGQAGFLVPATLVSNDPGEVRAFKAEHGQVVYKSVSGIRSIVRELDAAAEGRMHLLRSLPTQFQAYVPGLDVRVHVAGEETFAAEVSSGAVDYRYPAPGGPGAKLEAVELPDEVAGRCVALARRLDLAFCGIDLRRRPDGEYVCFEVNPMPAYSYYQAGTGQPISQALLRLLTADVRGGVRGRGN